MIVLSDDGVFDNNEVKDLAVYGEKSENMDPITKKKKIMEMTARYLILSKMTKCKRRMNQKLNYFSFLEISKNYILWPSKHLKNVTSRHR